VGSLSTRALPFSGSSSQRGSKQPSQQPSQHQSHRSAVGTRTARSSAATEGLTLLKLCEMRENDLITELEYTVLKAALIENLAIDAVVIGGETIAAPPQPLSPPAEQPPA
jgi:hypothetical protein